MGYIDDEARTFTCLLIPMEKADCFVRLSLSELSSDLDFTETSFLIDLLLVVGRIGESDNMMIMKE